MNYTALKAAIAAYTHRSDLTSVIPDFCDRARTRLGGELRSIANFTTGSVTSFVDGLSALPTNIAQLVAVTEDGIPKSFASVAESGFNLGSGYYSIIGGDLYVPDAGSTTVVDLTYYAIPAALVNGTDVSEGMNEFPGLWIYASCLEAALYLADDAAIQRYSDAYLATLQAANTQGRDIRFGPAPAMRDMGRNVTAGGSGL